MSLPDSAAWEQIEPILDEVLDAPVAEREARLDRLCDDDAELRATVRRLVAAADEPTDSLDRPAAEVAAELLGETAACGKTGPGYRPGDVVAGYRVEELVGRGGMGEVYRVFHPTLERDAALKVLPVRRTGSAEAQRLLVAEARAASRLDHPNIQTVFDAGETEDGRVYLALAYYDAPTLAARLAADGPLPIPDVLDVGRQLADGLAAAHEREIVHRDIKPSNLIALPGGRLKILDFGVARVADADPNGEATTYGTLAYMSPEQTRMSVAEARSDVWAIGVVLYELLTGRCPFRGPDDRTLIERIRTGEPDPLVELRPDTPPALAAIVTRCLRKDPAARPPGAATVRDELVRLARSTAAGELVDARKGPRGRVVVVATAAVLAGLGAWAAFGRGGASTASDEVLPAAATMTVLPFEPVDGDSATARLGQQLAVTVSTNLDGVGPIRTTEGIAVLTALRSGVPAGDDSAASALARRFATRSYLRGTLIETDGGLRVDAALHDATGGRAIGRLAVTAPSGDIAALTDSITLAVLRAVWLRGAVPTPSLRGLTTRSVPALRAYLEGELALADGRFTTAIAAFDSAFQADSTFWYARWRSVYPRTYEPATGLERSEWRELDEHREQLPEPDRLLIESLSTDGVDTGLAAQRKITSRFPGYWPGWWSYANALIHQGALVGRDLRDMRAALERTLELQPGYLPAWEHLVWIAVRQRDTTRAGEALAELEAAGEAGNSRLAEGLLPTYRAMVAAIGDPDLSAHDVDGKVRHVLGYAGPLPVAYFALDLLLFGDCAAQRTVGEAVLARRPRPEVAEAHRLMLAWALGCTGDWEAGVQLLAGRTMPVVDRFAPLAPYGFAVVGAWLGDVSVEAARALRPETVADSEAGAERTWLDGMLALAAGDREALEAARSALATHDGPHAEWLEASLGGFGLALDGDTVAAGRRLAAVEEEAAEASAFDGYAAPHPWLTGVNRLAAARWLAAAGDTSRALDLLGWEEGFLLERHFLMQPAGSVLGPRASLVRARLYAARGDTARAAFYYESVRRQLDGPATEELAAAAEEASRYVGSGFTGS